MSKTYLVVNALGYYACWFACILGAVAGLWFAGPLVVAAFIAVHLSKVSDRPREGLFLAACAGGGFVLDTALAAAGMYRFHLNDVAPEWMSPLWMVALWPAFGATMNASMRFMRGKLALLAVFGGVGGPLAYFAGWRLGAVEIGEPLWMAMAALAVAWAVATPLLMWGATRHDPWRAPEGAAAAAP
ncbi:MAG: DUF2878 domain-containing protein [Candidatus Sumerlaeia bacterium]|nr:DUF2878 domain-containing protein [Candidatus Sumerlaeia bacterium]